MKIVKRGVWSKQASQQGKSSLPGPLNKQWEVRVQAGTAQLRRAVWLKHSRRSPWCNTFLRQGHSTDLLVKTSPCFTAQTPKTSFGRLLSTPARDDEWQLRVQAHRCNVVAVALQCLHTCLGLVVPDLDQFVICAGDEVRPVASCNKPKARRARSRKI